MVPQIFLIHWHEIEVVERAGRIRDLGYQVRYEDADGARAGKHILAKPPAAVVIDLSRLPSHGRETAAYLQSTKAGRDIPIVFLPGDPAKMDKVRAAIPNATWATWETLGDTLERVAWRVDDATPLRLSDMRGAVTAARAAKKRVMRTKAATATAARKPRVAKATKRSARRA